ncbi:MAG: gamma-glutamyl-gamma-aminobutyrate hydrolase family protein [Armatimonadetes bacterium]|jgi:putative glutamine amidotransferase|nr:gamma-glutamyl-gamma-aminobutyrate hydrolase family protein [Armatimonadota bacterium]
MKRRPVIAITLGIESGAWRPTDDRGRFLPYAEAVRRAGGEPQMVGLERAADVLADPVRFLRGYDGLLLPGGGDVHPAAYPHPPETGGRPWDEILRAHHMRVEEDRDALELALAQAAFREGRPVLGICRGLQVLNVALGGQLILHLDPALGHQTQPDNSSAHHGVEVHPESRLADLLGRAGPLSVNSRHHQGVDADRVAPALRAAATATDGLVKEALEAPDHPWLIAVQWHPERPQDAECHAASAPLFPRFVAACGG